MKAFKRDSPFELAVQEIEQAMRDAGISITSYGAAGLMVFSSKHKRAAWIQYEAERTTEFPRTFEEERLVLAE